MRKKDDNDYSFEIWSNKKIEPKNFIDSFAKNVQVYANFKFGKLFYKSTSFFIRFNLISMNRLFGVGQSLQKEKQ